MSGPEWSSTPYNPQQQYTPVPSPPSAPPNSSGFPPRRYGRATLGVVALLAMLAGVLIGYAAGHGTKDDGKASAAGTSAITTDVPSEPPLTDETTDVPESVSPPAIKPSDFRITLKIKKKECFGSAGCNVSFQIDPQYVGAGDIESGSYEVTYVVRGPEDGPMINTFTLEDGKASFDDEEMASTKNAHVRLTARVTSIDPQ